MAHPKNRRRKSTPRDYLARELEGVRDWIGRLEDNDHWPKRWRASMLKYYRKRARELQAALKALDAEQDPGQAEGS